MERRGPGCTTVAGDWHEGVRGLGSVEWPSGRREGQTAWYAADDWRSDQRYAKGSLLCAKVSPSTYCPPFGTRFHRRPGERLPIYRLDYRTDV